MCWVGSKANIISAIDARMGEIYVAAFRRDGDSVIATSDEIVIAPAQYNLPQGDDWIGVGTGLLSEGAAVSLAIFPVLLLVVIIQLLYIRRVETV